MPLPNAPLLSPSSRLLVAFFSAILLAAPAHGGRVNVAKYQAVSASSESAGEQALFATDGIVGNENRWKSSAASGPHWVVVTLPLAMEIGSAHLYLGRDDIEPVANFSLQSWNGSAWVNIPGAVFNNNTLNIRNVVFATPVVTSRVRFYATDATVRVRELALFPPNGPGGYPIGTDVTLNLAKKRPTLASSTDGANYPKNSVDGYVDDNARWKSGSGAGPNTLEVDLGVSSRIGSVHLHFASTAATTVANFTVQYWNGSAWITFPGGVVNGNTQPALRVVFTGPVSASRVRLLLPDSGSQRVREFLVFAANGSDGYPLGTDVETQPAPQTKYDTYGDGFYKIVSRANGRSLVSSLDGTSQTQPATLEEEKYFQILYNLDSDTFRLRNRVTYRCLAAQHAGKNAGTKVVELPDYQAMPHELWRLQDVGNGDFRIVNEWNGLALETDNANPVSVALATPAGTSRQSWRFEYQTHYPKKGIAGYEGEYQRFKTNWSYNWGRDTGISPPAGFTFHPMQYGRWWPDFNTLPERYSGWHTTSRPLTILGYNEPEQTSQGNTPVDEGVALWKRLEQTDLPLVSPAPVNPFTPWINEFFNQVNTQGLRVDYTAIHWYSAPDANALINHLQNVYNTYGRPVWLTEFSNVDWSGNQSWTDEDCFRFLAEFTWRAEDLPWLKRYAIFPFNGGLASNNPWDRNGDRSNFFMNDGTTLTPFGEFYAAWDADRTMQDRTAYMLQGLASSHRLRASSTTSAPRTGTIRQSDISTQWALVPSGAANRWYLVSLRDGRRLRFVNNLLDLAPPGTTGPALEWTPTAPNASGYRFIDHFASSKSLRLHRVNDGSGAPTALDYTMENFGTVQDSTRWRLIKPYQPGEVEAPAPVTNLAATSGNNSVGLAWSQSPAADLLGYAIYRKSDATGAFERLTSGLTSTSYTDTTAVNGVTYRYAVTAVDWIANESVQSAEVIASPFAPGSTYASWAQTALAGVPAGQIGAAADADLDGLLNGLEYACLLDPQQPSASPLQVGQDAGGRTLLMYARNRLAGDVQFEIVATANMTDPASWQTLPATLVSQVPDGPVDRVTLRPAITGSAQMFYRLRAVIAQ